ncbi:hypothetical protein U3516DRAFT_533138 [Neocallimastix sp. 'constans']
MAYICTLNSSNYVNSCKFIKGYIISYSDIVHCNAIDDECEKIYSPESCKEGDEGALGIEPSENGSSSDKQYKICFGTNGVLLPKGVDYYSTNEERYIAFTTTKINKIYGKHNVNEIIVLNVGPDVVYADSLKDGQEKYFINQNYQSDNPESKPLIHCNGSKCVELDMPEIPADGEVHYLDGYSKMNVITCSSEGCTSENKCTGKINYPKYFINHADQKRVITCKINGCFLEEPRQGIYNQDRNNFDETKSLILCNSESCKYIDNKNVCNEAGDEGNVYSRGYTISICTEPINGYYKSGDSTTTQEISYIQCDSKSCKDSEILESCTKETIGALIKDSSNSIGICVDENKIITFNRYYEEKIYYNSNYNVFELTNDIKNIITCEGTKCSTKAATFGYYFNGGEDKEASNFIYCIYFHGCSKVSITTDKCKSSLDVITKDKKYYVCLTDNGSKTEELKVDANPVPIYNKIINSERISLTNGRYIGNSKTEFDIKIGNDGSVLLLTKATLEGCINLSEANECVSEPCSKKCYPTAYGGEYCVGTDNIIRYTKALESDTFTCQVIDSKGYTSNSVSGNVKFFFFNEFFEIINEIAPGMDNINIAYKCSYGTTNEITNCEIASGSYVVDGKYKVECTGFRQDYCVVSDKLDVTPTSTTSSPSPSSNSGTGSSSGSGSGSSTPTGTDNKSTTTPTLITIDDGEKNTGSGAVSLYYKLPSFMTFSIIFIITILYHM